MLKGAACSEFLLPPRLGSPFLPSPPQPRPPRYSPAPKKTPCTHHGVHGEVIVLRLEVEGVLVADSNLCMALEE